MISSLRSWKTSAGNLSRARLIKLGALALASQLLSSCSDPAVSIRYEFDQPDGPERAVYRWTVDASTDLDTPRLTESKQLRLVLRVEEEASDRSSSPERPLLAVVLTPESLTEDGVDRPPGAPLTMALDVDPLGKVRSIQVQQIPPTSLNALELDRLVTEFRPALPDHPVSIGETWPASVRVDGAVSRIRLDGEGRLEGFRLKSGLRLALLHVERRGDVLTSQTVGRAPVQLPGKVSSTMTAEIDLEGGRLFSASSRSVTLFTLSGEGGGLGGTLRVVIETRVHRA